MMKKRAKGGVVASHDSGNERVMNEAETPVHRKKGGKVDGGLARLRLDRPGRKTGGRVGADLRPLSASSSVAPLTVANKTSK